MLQDNYSDKKTPLNFKKLIQKPILPETGKVAASREFKKCIKKYQFCFQLMKEKQVPMINYLNINEVQEARRNIQKVGEQKVKQLIENLQKQYRISYKDCRFRDNQFIIYDRKGSLSLMSKDQITTFQLISSHAQKLRRAIMRKEKQLISAAYQQLYNQYSKLIIAFNSLQQKLGVSKAGQSVQKIQQVQKQSVTTWQITKSTASTANEQPFHLHLKTANTELLAQLRQKNKQIERQNIQNQKLREKHINLQNQLSIINQTLQKILKKRTPNDSLQIQSSLQILPIAVTLKQNIKHLVRKIDDFTKAQKKNQLLIEQLKDQKQVLQLLYNKNQTELKKATIHCELLKQELQRKQQELEEVSANSFARSAIVHNQQQTKDSISNEKPIRNNKKIKA